VDFPNRTKAAALIGALEDLTLAAGGRIYLAKDTLARPDSIRAMYEELADFDAATKAADPSLALATDLVRRLNLREAS